MIYTSFSVSLNTFELSVYELSIYELTTQGGSECEGVKLFILFSVSRSFLDVLSVGFDQGLEAVP